MMEENELARDTTCSSFWASTLWKCAIDFHTEINYYQVRSLQVGHH